MTGNRYLIEQAQTKCQLIDIFLQGGRIILHPTHAIECYEPARLKFGEDVGGIVGVGVASSPWWPSGGAGVSGGGV
jgi:hypothetical protein